MPDSPKSRPQEPRRSQPRPIADLLPKVLQRRGLSRSGEFASVCRAWERAVPPEIAARTRPLAFRNGVLSVQVRSAPLLEELRCFRRGEVLQRLNHDLARLRGTSVWVQDLDLRLC